MSQPTSNAADTTSYWTDSASLPRFPKLDGDAHVDVAIVGGGITGLTAAYLLAAEGKSIALIDRDRCALADTGHTSAHLTMVTDRRLTDLVSDFGRDHARAVYDAGLAAIAQIDAIVRQEEIDCDFAWVPGYLHSPGGGSGNADPAPFQREVTLAADLGFDVSFLADVPGIGGPGVRFDDQARFHPRKYLAGLARRIVERGGRIHEHSDAEEFIAEPLSVRTREGTITCDDIVLATHTPLTGVRNILGATMFQTKLALYTSYVVAGRVERGQLPDALFWDTDDSYHYLRLEPHRDHDLVIFGGADHKTGQVEDTRACYQQLERRITSLLPGIDITHRWSGQVIETPDGLPFIGPTAPHQFAATGFSGNGMTFGTLAAMMARDAILERPNPWASLFDTGRTNIRGGLWDYLKENKDYPYYIVRDRFAGAQGRSLRSVKRGQGKVLDLDGTRVAAFRDLDGTTTVRSAVCTHMGCFVAWNDAERTWDCPCHGSRFKPTGEVLSGPAESPLSEVKQKN